VVSKNYQLEQVKLFVASLLNEVQNEHAKLLAQLKTVMGKTKEFEDTAKVLSQIYDAKIEMLNKVYDKIQGV